MHRRKIYVSVTKLLSLLRCLKCSNFLFKVAMVKMIVVMAAMRTLRRHANTYLATLHNFVATKPNVLMPLTFATANVIVSMGQMKNLKNATRNTARLIRNSSAR